MKELKIDLNEIASDSPKDYEKSGRNYVQVEVQLPDGNIVKDSKYCVNITLSKDAMVGLALNLLREAYNPDPSSNQLRMWELFPAMSDGATEVLGVSMHPQSCELKVFEGDDGPLQDLLKASRDQQ
jgi:hypothetical protein